MARKQAKFSSSRHQKTVTQALRDRASRTAELQAMESAAACTTSAQMSQRAKQRCPCLAQSQKIQTERRTLLGQTYSSMN